MGTTSLPPPPAANLGHDRVDRQLAEQGLFGLAQVVAGGQDEEIGA